MSRSVAALAAILVLAAAPAFAGIADSPLPVLVPGQTTNHLYSVPGVVNSGNLGTYFSCTSTSLATMTVGVELFGTGGGAPANNAATTAVSLPAGGSVMFGTQTPTGRTINKDLGAPNVTVGSARILSTDKKLTCTAFLSDIGATPPTSMTYLTIIAKTKQKAAN